MLNQSIKIILRFCLIFLSITTFKSFAVNDIDKDALCKNYFPDGVVSNKKNKTITFNYNSNIANNPDKFLESSNVVAPSSFSSCDDDVCMASGNPAESYNPGNFKDTSSKLSLNLSGHETDNLVLNEYKNITLESNSTLNVLGNGTSRIFKFKNLTLNYKTVLKLIPGDYWIDNLTAGSSSTIEIMDDPTFGTGDVRIFLKKQTSFNSQVRINQSSKSDMLIYGYNKLIFGSPNYINAFIYADGDITTSNNTNISGAISGHNVTLNSATNVTYSCDESTPPEPQVLDHFEVIHNTSGSTCAAEPIEIKACANANCTEAYNTDVDVKLLINNSTHSVNTVSEGSVLTNLSYRFNSSAIISLNSIDSVPFECKDNQDAATSCEINFSETNCYSCAVTWQDGVTSFGNSNDNKDIEFGKDSQLVNNPDNILTSSSVTFNNGSSTKSCEDTHCLASGSPVLQPILGRFLVIDDATIGMNANHFASISLGDGEEHTFSNEYSEYRIAELTLEQDSKVVFSPGDYWIEKLSTQDNESFSFERKGDGLIRIFLTGHIDIEKGSKINTGSDPEQFLIITQYTDSSDDAKLHIKENVEINALIYAEGDSHLKNGAVLNGAISAEKVKLDAVSKVIYGCDYEPPEEPEPSICEAPFIDGATSFASSGADNIELEDGARIINNPDTELASFSVSSHNKSYCQTASGSSEKCTASEQPVEAMILPDFKYVPENFPFFPYPAILAVYPNDLGRDVSYLPYWSKVNVNDNESVTFTRNEGSEYRIEELNIGENATLNLAPGDYWINNLNTKKNASGLSKDAKHLTINVIGEGTVNFYVRSASDKSENDLQVEILDNAQINSSEDDSLSESATNFRIYAWGKFHIKKDADVNAYIFSLKGFEIEEDSTLTGAASSKEIKLKNDSTIDFTCSPNSSLPGEYLIIHQQSGLTCEPEPITVRACLNGDCSVKDPNISTNVQVIVTDENGNAEAISIYIENGESNSSFNFVEPGIATLSLGGGLDASCDDGEDDSCKVAFSDSGFLVALQDSPSCESQDIQITALKTNPETRQCDNILLNQTKNVNLSFNYASDNTIDVKLKPLIGNESMPDAEDKMNFELSFDSNGEAVIPNFSYFDAGKISLMVDFTESSGEFEGVNLKGEGEAVFYPARFVVNEPADGTLFTAGNDFDLTLSAQCADDNSPVITKNYRPQSVNSIQLKPYRTALETSTFNGQLKFMSSEFEVPYAAVNSETENWKILTLDPSLEGTWSNGQLVDVAAEYSEVGEPKLQVKDSNYFGYEIKSTEIDLGRFIPHHLVQTVKEHSQFTPYCDLLSLIECGDFVYTGQKWMADLAIGAIGYTTPPLIKIEPFNAHNEVTHHYVEQYMKLSAEKINEQIIEPELDRQAMNTNGESYLQLSYIKEVGQLISAEDYNNFNEESDEEAGINFYQLSNTDNMTYDRSWDSLVDPFTSNVELKIDSIIDDDDVSTTYLDEENVQIEAAENIMPQGVKVMFARWRIHDSYGSSVVKPLNEIEYFEDGRFNVHSDNHFTAYDISNFDFHTVTGMDLDNITLEDTNTSDEIFKTGSINTLLIKLEQAKAGTVVIEYEAPEWFKYDWDEDLDLQNNPSGVATFGIFNKPSKRIISEQEIFQ